MPDLHLGDDRLDAAPLLVALPVDLLGTRQQRLDLAEVDKHVVTVAGLLDDSGHDLVDAIDVLLVHHLALGFADRCRMTCFAVCAAMRPKSSGVTSSRLIFLLGHLRPVDLEVVVGDQRVLALAASPPRAAPAPRASARAPRRAASPPARQASRSHRRGTRPRRRARPSRAVTRQASSCMRRAARPRARRRAHRSSMPFVPLDLTDGVDDLLAHWLLLLLDQIGPHDLVVGNVDFVASVARATLSSSRAATTRPRKLLAPVDGVDLRTATLRPRARAK